MENDVNLYDDFKLNPESMFKFLDFFFKFKPYDYQKKFLTACLTKSRIAGKWSRQSGKSQCVAAYCAMRCLLKPTSIMITAPTQNQSSELFSKIRTLLEGNEHFKSYITKSTQTELQIKESRIKALPSGPEGRTIRGFTADIVVIEEAGDMKDEIINQVITPMLASKKDEGQVIKIGTPLLKNHFYRSCFIDPNYEVVNVTWRDGVRVGQYSIDFINEQKQNLNDTEFQTEYEAMFCEESASFFPSILLSNCTEDYPLMQVI